MQENSPAREKEGKGMKEITIEFTPGFGGFPQWVAKNNGIEFGIVYLGATSGERVWYGPHSCKSKFPLYRGTEAKLIKMLADEE